ncbi:MAG TPA: hypothetical protein VFE53_08785 [Mucilaginibacter sp.]|jgi:hypothetical protein|nr:hypothetical protein [Mucilaginibacter sp.]
MSVYTISPDLLRNIEKEEGVYFTDILFVFTQRNNHFKVSRDKKGHVIDAYLKIVPNADIIKTWLDLMSFKPSTFEHIDVSFKDIDCEETKFFKLCKETKDQNKIIYYSAQNIKKYNCTDHLVYFEETAITVLDRDLAKQELNQSNKNGDTYINSQVAKGNSNINKSTNN